MRVRKIDPVTGRVFGGDQAAFLVNDAEAVAQSVRTRLGLWLGQWYLDTTDGTPWATQVLGKYTEATRDLAVRARILGTQGVNSILSYSSSLDRASRKWTVNVTLDTIYGVVTTAAQVSAN